jgi:dipeptidyl-peptidase-4
VEGFSFGGTMTALLVGTASEYFHYGIAGGGVYDWMLYDTHYTERFMSTPQDNPEGYAKTRVVDRMQNYPALEGKADGSVMLKLTHGTGDDNVHFQNTLQLIDQLQKQGAAFDFMIYPDGMHGYRGYQGAHFQAANNAFWEKYLLN